MPTADQIRHAMPLVAAGLFVALFVLERAAPLRRQRHGFWHRLLVNLLFTAVAFLIGGQLIRPTVVYLAGWTDALPFGLLPWIDLPYLAEFAIGFLLLDVSFYAWHRLNHELPILWRFHRVHHIDPDMDVTTAFRFHYVEMLASVGFRVVQIGVIGVDVWTLAIYEFVFQLSTMFHHSNLRLPLRVERVLNAAIVTPRMHGIHHSDIVEETNSNYSVVFRLWDQLAGTLVLNVPQDSVHIGVEGPEGPEPNRLNLLVFEPLYRYRPVPEESRKRRQPLPGDRHRLVP